MANIKPNTKEISGDKLMEIFKHSAQTVSLNQKVKKEEIKTKTHGKKNHFADGIGQMVGMRDVQIRPDNTTD